MNGISSAMRVVAHHLLLGSVFDGHLVATSQYANENNNNP
jgi:hypothetical protein